MHCWMLSVPFSNLCISTLLQISILTEDIIKNCKNCLHKCHLAKSPRANLPRRVSKSGTELPQNTQLMNLKHDKH